MIWVPQRSRRLSASGMLAGRGACRSRLDVPQRSRRLSASGIRNPRLCARSRIRPQRSRRLSASGMRRGGGLGTLRRHGASKKQTPFSVWYRSAPPAPAPMMPLPQRSRRLSASGMAMECVFAVPENRASKKQTPFSVWYQLSPGGWSPLPPPCLKEADAFQRLV